MGKLTDSMQQWFGKPNKESKGSDGSKGGPQRPDTQENKDYKSLRIQPTPNPHACQFVTNKTVIASGSMGFDSAQDAKGDAFAEALFNIYGIESVFLKENFVTVTKSPTVGWNTIVEEIEKVIETHLTFYDNAPTEPVKTVAEGTGSGDKEINLKEFPNFPDQEKLKIIDTIFDQAIRPALANDGGDLVLLGISGNVVQIRYQGACGTCPSATSGTLQYIESLLKQHLHPDLEVVAQ